MIDAISRAGLLAAALIASSLTVAFAQSKSDVASQISNSVPDNGRGQITAAGLRGVLNSLNGARGSVNGIATLDALGRLPSAQIPPVLAPTALTLPTTDQGSTGDLSGMSVAPNASSATGSLGSILARSTTIPGLKPQGLLFDGPPPISHIPTGNPTLSNGSLVLQTYTGAVDTREIGASLGMVSSTGAGHSGDGTLGNGDKIVLYLGQRAVNGSFNTWAFNPLSEIAAGNTTWGGDWIAEFDKNNLSQHVGDAAGPAGLSDKHSWGIQVVSGGTEAIAKRNTAAFSVASFTTAGQWNRGYLCQPGAVRLTCYEDHSNAATMIQDWGSHAVSIDLRNATNSIAAIALKNGSPLSARNSANTGDVPLIYSSGVNTVIGAESNVSIIKPLILSNQPNGGVAVASLCVTSTGVVFLKTTSGACL